MKRAFGFFAIVLGIALSVGVIYPVPSSIAEEAAPDWLAGVWEGTLTRGPEVATVRLEFLQDKKVKLWGRNPYYEFEGVGAVKVSGDEVSVEGMREASGGRRSSAFRMSLKRMGDNQLEGTYYGGSGAPNQASLKKVR